MLTVPTDFLKQLLPILRLLGIDPAGMANKLGREQVAKRLEAGVPAVVKRLEKDKLTPAAKATTPEGERVFIRAALYLSLKAAFTEILPQGRGANYASDFLRDTHDDACVAIVGPQMDATTPTADAVRLVNAALIERLF